MATLGAGSAVHTDLTMQPGQARAPGRRRTLRWLCSAPSHHWTAVQTCSGALATLDSVLCVVCVLGGPSACARPLQNLVLFVLCTKRM